MGAVGWAAGRCPGGLSPAGGWAVGAWGGVRFPVVLVLGYRVRGWQEGVLQGGGGRAGGPAGVVGARGLSGGPAQGLVFGPARRTCGAQGWAGRGRMLGGAGRQARGWWGL